VENSRDARPQAGLSQADMVIETMAEGGIPRFIALFQKNNIASIGPVRSVRSYFADIAKNFSLPFAHCGGSEEALNMIDNEKLMSMNEINNGRFFWRDKSRKAPHNLYTSSARIRKLIQEKGFTTQTNTFLKFGNEYWNNSNLNSTDSIIIKPNKYYTTSYKFKNGNYFKSMDGILCNDVLTNDNLTAKNIIIQITNINLQRDGLHLSIDLNGEGNGYILSDGKFTRMKWCKNKKSPQTLFKDENGNEITLSPGKTWWHIIDKNTSVSIFPEVL
jgi:hypothetical protein